MSSLLIDCRRVWASTVHDDFPSLYKTLLLTAAWLALALLVIWGLDKSGTAPPVAMAALPVAVFGLMGWCKFMYNAPRQHNGADAHLVPRLRLRLRHTAIIAWCATLLPLVALAPATAYPALFMVGAALMTVALGLIAARRLEGLALAAALLVTQHVLEQDAARMAWFADGVPLLALACAALVLAWVGLNGVLPVKTVRRDHPLPRWGVATFNYLGAVLGTRHEGRDLTFANGIAPAQYRVVLAKPILGTMFFTLLFNGPVFAMGNGHFPFVLLATNMITSHLRVVEWANRLFDSRREIDLVRLAPFMPSGGRMHPTLAWQLIGIVGVHWLAMSALGMTLAYWLGDSHDVSIIWGASTGLFAMLAMVLRPNVQPESRGKYELGWPFFAAAIGIVALGLLVDRLPWVGAACCAAVRAIFSR